MCERSWLHSCAASARARSLDSRNLPTSDEVWNSAGLSGASPGVVASSSRTTSSVAICSATRPTPVWVSAPASSSWSWAEVRLGGTAPAAASIAALTASTSVSLSSYATSATAYSCSACLTARIASVTGTAYHRCCPLTRRSVASLSATTAASACSDADVAWCCVTARSRLAPTLARAMTARTACVRSPAATNPIRAGIATVAVATTASSRARMIASSTKKPSTVASLSGFSSLASGGARPACCRWRAGRSGRGSRTARPRPAPARRCRPRERSARSGCAPARSTGGRRRRRGTWRPTEWVRGVAAARQDSVRSRPERSPPAHSLKIACAGKYSLAAGSSGLALRIESEAGHLVARPTASSWSCGALHGRPRGRSASERLGRAVRRGRGSAAADLRDDLSTALPARERPTEATAAGPAAGPGGCRRSRLRAGVRGSQPALGNLSTPTRSPERTTAAAARTSPHTTASSAIELSRWPRSFRWWRFGRWRGLVTVVVVRRRRAGWAVCRPVLALRSRDPGFEPLQCDLEIAE